MHISHYANKRIYVFKYIYCITIFYKILGCYELSTMYHDRTKLFNNAGHSKPWVKMDSRSKGVLVTFSNHKDQISNTMT